MWFELPHNDILLTNIFFGVKILLLSKPDDCGRISHEESPGFIGQGCRVTPGGGDSKDSATEIDCQNIGDGGKVR